MGGISHPNLDLLSNLHPEGRGRSSGRQCSSIQTDPYFGTLFQPCSDMRLNVRLWVEKTGREEQAPFAAGRKGGTEVGIGSEEGLA